MNDRTLLELAAKAAGIEVTGHDPKLGLQYVNGSEDSPFTDYWNPLADDGDAFRLSVKLNMQVTSDAFNCDTEILYNRMPCELVQVLHENHGDDPYAATRRAIVRAAAEIGKGME